MTVSPPVAVAVEVAAAQPIEADAAAMAATERRRGQASPAVYLVMVRLAAVPPATGSGWALYVGDLRIPKYWQYLVGIFFKIFDPSFFSEHAGKPLRFSADTGTTFAETGLTMPAAEVVSDVRAELPTQQEVLAR